MSDKPDGLEASKTQGEPSQAPKRRPMGRSTKLNSKLIESFVQVLQATSTPIAVMAEAAGVSRQSFFRWMAQGEALDREGKTGITRDLWVAVTRARAEGTVATLAQVRKLALQEKDWRGLTWELERTRPKEFGYRVRIYVEEELTDAFNRLKHHFKGRPEIWEEIAQVIAGELSPEDEEAAAVPPPTAELEKSE